MIGRKRGKDCGSVAGACHQGLVTDLLPASSVWSLKVTWHGCWPYGRPCCTQCCHLIDEILMTMSPTEFDNSRCDTGNYWLPFNSTSLVPVFHVDAHGVTGAKFWGWPYALLNINHYNHLLHLILSAAVNLFQTQEMELHLCWFCTIPAPI